MNKIILASLLVLSFSACTQKSDETANQQPSENIINLEAKSGVVTGSGDFGILNQSDSSKVLTFRITNNGTEPLVGPASIDNSNFSILFQNCASVTVKSSCTIKVSFDPKSKSGPYSANLMLDSVFASLSATVNVPVVTPSVDYLISGASATSVNFGQMTDKQSVLKSISIKNTGSQALTDTVVVPSGYTLSYDACSGKSIAKGSSCSIRVTLSGAGKSGIIAGDLVYGGKSLPLSGEVIAPATFSNVVLMNGTSVISSYDFGQIASASNGQLVLTIKNTGTGAAALATASLASADFSIIYNQCSNISLAPNSSCQVRVLFSAVGKSPIAYASSLSFGDKSLPLAATVLPPPAAFTVTNIALSADSKSFTVTGTNLMAVSSAKILETNQTEIDTLVIDSKTATQIILKPSKNLTLPAGDVIMRIQ